MELIHWLLLLTGFAAGFALFFALGGFFAPSIPKDVAQKFDDMQEVIANLESIQLNPEELVKRETLSEAKEKLEDKIKKVEDTLERILEYEPFIHFNYDKSVDESDGDKNADESEVIFNGDGVCVAKTSFRDRCSKKAEPSKFICTIHDPDRHNRKVDIHSSMLQLILSHHRVNAIAELSPEANWWKHSTTSKETPLIADIEVELEGDRKWNYLPITSQSGPSNVYEDVKRLDTYKIDGSGLLCNSSSTHVKVMATLLDITDEQQEYLYVRENDPEIFSKSSLEPNFWQHISERIHKERLLPNGDLPQTTLGFVVPEDAIPVSGGKRKLAVLTCMVGADTKDSEIKRPRDPSAPLNDVYWDYQIIKNEHEFCSCRTLDPPMDILMTEICLTIFKASEVFQSNKKRKRLPLLNKSEEIKLIKNLTIPGNGIGLLPTHFDLTKTTGKQFFKHKIIDQKRLLDYAADRFKKDKDHRDKTLEYTLKILSQGGVISTTDYGKVEQLAEELGCNKAIKESLKNKVDELPDPQLYDRTYAGPEPKVDLTKILVINTSKWDKPVCRKVSGRLRTISKPGQLKLSKQKRDEYKKLSGILTLAGGKYAES